MRPFILSVCLLLSACASVPLATMIQLAGFGVGDFRELTATDIRSRITLDQPLHIDVEHTDIQIQLETSQGALNYAFPLQIIGSEAIAAESGWLSDRPARTRYELRLSEQGVADFERLQRELDEDNVKGMELNVSTKILGREQVAADADPLLMSIEIRLNPKDDYLMLFEDVELVLDDEPREL